MNLPFVVECKFILLTKSQNQCGDWQFDFSSNAFQIKNKIYIRYI